MAPIVREPAEPMEPIRVIVVDDHDLFRTGLSTLLSAQRDIELVAQASGGVRAIRLAMELRPDVILMDLRMPDLGGPEATQRIVRELPATRIVVLTAMADGAAVTSAVQSGACGFMAKDSPIDDVIAAVRAAASGAAWLSPRAAEIVLGTIRHADAKLTVPGAALEDLSPRELDVLRLIARGMENAEIAKELNISPRTAKNHVSSILTKLGVTNRIQAAIYAVQRGYG